VSEEKIMDKEFYRALLPLVNDKQAMEILEGYAVDRIRALHNALEQAQSLEAVRSLQGRISELRRFKTLREEVLKGSE
jgi:hypothetical protein